MSLDQSIVAAAKKDYTEFEEIINKEIENKMKTYIGGFQDYLEKNAFTKDYDGEPIDVEDQEE